MVVPWRALLRRQVCPYCFEPYWLHLAPFRCASPPARCSPQPDAVRAKAWDESQPMGRVLPGGANLRTAVRCPDCGKASGQRLCPHCHMELPATTGRCRHLIFAVIGAKEAGKSHYLAVLIEQVRKQVGPALDMLLEPLDDRTIKRYRQDFYTPVYLQAKVIEATRSALGDQRVRTPLVYSLSFCGRDLFGRRCVKGVVTLAFFDTAGEDLNEQSVMSTVNKYIYRSDGIIVLLDPLQLQGVRARLPAGMGLPVLHTDTADILTRTTALIEAGRRLGGREMISTPIAVAFSKFDAVAPLLDAQSQLNAVSDHRGGFDLADHQAVSAEVQALLSAWDSVIVREQVERRYRRCGFFGLTALGCNPHGSQEIPRVLPRRVEDPFLWLLHCHGLIPTARRG